MDKFFNTAGLCFPAKHYMVAPLGRLKDVVALIDRGLYFTIHAPRQTGKTTYLYALAQKLNAEGRYISLVVSFERAGYDGISMDTANRTLIHSVYSAARRQLPENQRPEDPEVRAHLDLKHYLEKWAESQEKPIVLLVDEIDALLDNVLISVLRQFRDGYQARPGHFPSSVVLVGLRDVRDYKAHIRADSTSLGTASPFNVKSDSLFLANFSPEEVHQLLDQHTQETGQVFPREVKDEIYRLGSGQPWLTNALANQVIFKILDNDYARRITPGILGEAKNQLILRRDTHLDSLVDKLREERVRRIVQAIINGDNIAFDILDDDISYVRDLGIVSPSSPLKFANPIYGEIIPRVMASPIEESIPEEIQPRWFVDEQGELDMKRLLEAFQEFYRENAESWLDRFTFKESAHHLLLMAFLQRVVNAGGEIVREMAVGNRRVDLLVKFGSRRLALELKIKRGEQSIEKAKAQLDRYLDRLGLREGYLVIFDPADADWQQKLFMKETVYKDKTIIMVGV
jgi:hypothetical protein